LLALPAFWRAVSVLARRRVADALVVGSLALLGAAAVLLATVPMNIAVYGSPIPLHLSGEIAKLGLNRTGFIGGPIPREDGPDAQTQQIFP
jgi:hypothetical protein